MALLQSSASTYLPAGTGAVTRRFADKARERVAVEDYGAPTDGTTDASFAFNAAIAALGTGGGDIELRQAAYAIGAPLSGTGKNIRFIGCHGQSLLKKLASGGYGSFMHADLGVYEGYRFENVAFDGQRRAVIAAALPGHNFHLVGARNVSFDRCSFREIHNIFLVGCRNVRIENCDFWGTRSGIMTAGQQDPAAVSAATAQYGECSILGQANIDILWKKCRFHFPQTGINQAATQTSRCRGLRIEDCEFRSDWWNAPYVTLRFTPTAIDWSSRILTCTGIDFVATGHFNDFQVLSVPIGITTGTAFSVNGGEIVATGAFTSAQIGDVFETADGKRAELTAVQDANTAWHGGWESVDTYEPCADAASQNFRLRRYYSSICGNKTIYSFLANNQIQVVGTDFTNPFSGEQLHTDAGLTPLTIECRELAKAYYAGVQINGGQEGLSVLNNRFRGGWADQCSMFDSDAPEVIGNDFRYGQDEGITCTRCIRARLALNHFISCGSSAIFLGDAHHASVIGNTIHIWNVSNTNVRGAIENAGLGMTIFGNTFTTVTGVNANGSNYCINLDTDSSAGTVIGGNIDGGAKLGTFLVTSDAAPTANSITARDCLTIAGTGAGNVSTGGGGGGGMTIGGAVGSSTAKSIPYIDAGNNLAQDNAHLQYDPSTYSLSIGAGGLGARLGLQARSAGENVLITYDESQNIRCYIVSTGELNLFARPADVSHTSNSSPTQTFWSTRWTGSAQNNEEFTVGITRLDSGANRNVFAFADNNSNASLAIAGAGGQVAVGYGFPSAALLTTLGLLHARSTGDADPALTAQRNSSGQTAPILAVLDENSVKLSYFNKGGYFVTKLNTAPGDGDLAAGEAAIWLDQTNSACKFMIKAKQADGTVRTGSVSLT